MKKTATIPAAVLAALACSGSLQAHHSDSMYDPSTPIWVKGTVVGFENVDPHTLTTLEARSQDGQVRRWAIEGPGRFQLDVGTKIPVPKFGASTASPTHSFFPALTCVFWFIVSSLVAHSSDCGHDRKSSVRGRETDVRDG